MKKVLVIHTWGMGDIILATPMLKSLAFNGYQVDLVLSSKINFTIIKEASFLNKIFFIQKKWEFIKFFRRYDYVVATAGTNPKKIKLLNWIIQAKEVLSLAQERNIHRIDMNLKIVSNLLDKVKREPYIYIPKENEILSRYLTKQKNIGFAIGSGSNQKFKRWDMNSFRQLILKLEGNKLIFIGPDELELEEQIKDLEVTVVKASLEESIKLISKLDLLIGNDNGLMHIAHATNTNTVTIFGMTNEKETGGYRENSESVFLDIDCRPCFDPATDKLGCESLDCLKKITVEEVYNRCQKFL